MSRGQMRGLFVVLAFLFLGCRRGTTEVNHELRAASVLFGQFETVFYANVDLLSSSGAYERVAKDDADNLRSPFGLLEEGLNVLGPNTSQEILSSSEAVLVGAKDFRAPSGLGPVRSQRCDVSILKGTILKRNEFDLHKYFHQPPAASVAGAPVWNWSAKLGEFGEEDPDRPSSFYAAQIAGSYLLVSNNLEDLQATAKGLVSSENPEISLAGIRDWELVRQHKVWGYRRYRHSEVGVVDQVAAGMSVVTPDAKALVSVVTPATEALIFFADFEKKDSVLRLLSSDTNGDTAAKMSSGPYLPPLKFQARGVWETRIPLAGNEESFNRLCVVMQFLGSEHTSNALLTAAPET
jgi:hypothetical protein